ncbi:MAG: polyketide synthase dehydratase domain-containing protein [Myxococcales bacterium]|nr:polyketide synthase dehydratase domain-containing protein [Myxococcales bacterium]
MLTVGGDGRFEVASVGEDGVAHAHADGSVVGGSAGMDWGGLEEARARCGEVLGGDEFYAGLAGSGIELGARFRWLEAAWRGEGELVARLRGVEAADGVGLYGVPPGLIDGCFQLVTALAEAAGAGEALMMLGVERLRWWGVPAGAVWCHLRRRARGAGLTVADAWVYGRTGARWRWSRDRGAAGGAGVDAGAAGARVLGVAWAVDEAGEAAAPGGGGWCGGGGAGGGDAGGGSGGGGGGRGVWLAGPWDGVVDVGAAGRRRRRSRTRWRARRR